MKHHVLMVVAQKAVLISVIFRRALQMSETARRKRVLLGVTGSVAAVKYPILALELLKQYDVKVVLTKGAQLMNAATIAYDSLSWDAYRANVTSGNIIEHVDDDEWRGYSDVGKHPVLHIDVRG
ncbi:MAG: hypothetical protein JST16_00685, partial [Bdellovibrionales bacterium]|nr:hypothetical protein [Bdellovibrionales bacterium]